MDFEVERGQKVEYGVELRAAAARLDGRDRALVRCQMPERLASSACVSFFALRALRRALPMSLGVRAI